MPLAVILALWGLIGITFISDRIQDMKNSTKRKIKDAFKYLLKIFVIILFAVLVVLAIFGIVRICIAPYILVEHILLEIL